FLGTTQELRLDGLISRSDDSVGAYRIIISLEHRNHFPNTPRALSEPLRPSPVAAAAVFRGPPAGGRGRRHRHRRVPGPALLSRVRGLAHLHTQRPRAGRRAP